MNDSELVALQIGGAVRREDNSRADELVNEALDEALAG